MESKNDTWIIPVIIIVGLVITVAIILIIIYATPHSSNSIRLDFTSPQLFHKFVFVNNCPYTIWPGALGNSGMIAPNNGGWKMDSGTTTTLYIPKGWQGRFWPRTGCDVNGANCETGDCGRLQCNGRGGTPNVSLAEFTLDSGPNNDQDFYDISFVDAISQTISIDLIPDTFINKNPNDRFSCGSSGCTENIDFNQCPSELQLKNNQGEIVSCISPCQKIDTDQVCCRGQYNSNQTCITSQWPNPYNLYPPLVKNACPTGYSFAYDDATSTFYCNSKPGSPILTGYVITFCPGK